MFDQLATQGRRATRRTLFLVGSMVLQCVVVAVLFALHEPASGRGGDGPPVAVKFFHPAQRAAAPPPPPPLAAKKPSAPVTVRKKAEIPKPVAPVPVVQPKQVPQAIAPPVVDPPEEAGASAEEGGSPSGVAGGVAGGVPGGDLSSVGQTGGGSGGEIDEAPRYVTGEFKKPVEAEPGCVRNAIRLPPQLVGFVSAVTVKFAVGRDGSVSLVQLMTRVPDPRIEGAIRSGLKSCRWLPGTDGQGRAFRLWVIMQIRFTTG